MEKEIESREMIWGIMFLQYIKRKTSMQGEEMKGKRNVMNKRKQG